MAQRGPKSNPPANGAGAYLFVEDEERIVRFRLGSARVSIGRDQSNDIWIEHPDVQKHALVIVRRDGHDVMKVYDGALVRLNDVGVTKMHRLYGGDRITVADREFLYGRDDTMPELAIALTIDDGKASPWAVILRKTRVRVGRRDADVVINDPAVSERHLRLEAYASDALFCCDLGSAMGTRLDGQPIDGRVAVRDGSRLQIGRVSVTLRILPVDAHGLLQPPAPTRARPKAVDTPLGARDYPLDEVTAPAKPQPGPAPARPEPADEDPNAPPPTVIGALAQLAQAEAANAPQRTKKRPRPSSKRSDSWRPAHAPPDRPAPPTPRPPKVPKSAKKRRSRQPKAPSVKIAAEVYDRERQQTLSAKPADRKKPIDGPSLPRSEPARKYGAGRANKQQRMVPAASSAPPRSRRQILHEKLTDVLDTNNVRDLVGERYVAAYQNVPPSDGAAPTHPERERRYRPSQPGGARILTDQKLVARPKGADVPLDPFGVHDQLTQARHYREVDKVQLTNMLDIVGDKPRLDHERVGLDPDAMPEQLRRQEELAAARGKRGPIDGARRRHARESIDSGRVLGRDED